LYAHAVGKSSRRGHWWEWPRGLRSGAGNALNESVAHRPGDRKYHARGRASDERHKHHVPRDCDSTWRRTSGQVVGASRHDCGNENGLFVTLLITAHPVVSRNNALLRGTAKHTRFKVCFF